jgi:hypothetical protein
MAVLSAADRDAVTEEFMTKNMAPLNLLAVDIAAMTAALDDYFNLHAVDVNAAIPLPARTAMSQAQKAQHLTYLIAQRYLKGT